MTRASRSLLVSAYNCSRAARPHYRAVRRCPPVRGIGVDTKLPGTTFPLYETLTAHTSERWTVLGAWAEQNVAHGNEA